MKKALFAVGCLVMAGSTQVAFADGEAAAESASPISVTLSVTSDYRFRGQSQNSRNPAVQGSFDYTADNGIFAGVWASNIDFSDTGDTESFMEGDIYVGYNFDVSEGTTGAVKATYYYYPEQPGGVDYDYLEAQLSLSHSLHDATLTAELNYSPDYFGGSGSAVAVAAGIEHPLWGRLSASGHVGHQWIDDNATFGTDDYMYWDLGVGIDFGRFDIDARYVGTNLSEADCFGGTNLCEAGFVATATISFP